MLGGYENKWEDDLGNTIVRNDIKRYKRFLLSLDVDLTKIETKNKTLKTIYSIFNVLKVPAPAIEFNTLGKFRLHPVAY
jgi:regulatory protein YycH of two-component signal transduction system YycFG